MRAEEQTAKQSRAGEQGSTGSPAWRAASSGVLGGGFQCSAPCCSSSAGSQVQQGGAIVGTEQGLISARAGTSSASRPTAMQR